jgi:hypothetical protein
VCSSPRAHGFRAGRETGLSSAHAAGPLVETFEPTYLRVVARENSCGTNNLAKQLGNEAKAPVHALAESLNHQIRSAVVGVAIDDERREPIGFAVDEPVRSSVNRQLRAVRNCCTQTLAKKRALVDDIARTANHADGDLRLAAPQRPAERASALLAYTHEIARLRV